LVQIFAETGQTVIPIVNDKVILTGVVDLNDFKSLLLDSASHHTLKVKELMHDSASTLAEFEHIHEVLKKFDSCGQNFLPVLKPDKTFIGLASKSKLMDLFRESLTEREISIE